LEFNAYSEKLQLLEHILGSLSSIGSVRVMLPKWELMYCWNCSLLMIWVQTTRPNC